MDNQRVLEYIEYIDRENKELERENFKIEQRIGAYVKGIFHHIAIFRHPQEVDFSKFKAEVDSLTKEVIKTNKELSSHFSGEKNKLYVDPDGELAELERRIKLLRRDADSIGRSIDQEISSFNGYGGTYPWERHYDGRDIHWD